MRIGELVIMSARSLYDTFGVGVIVKELGHTQVQVWWSKYGLGKKCYIHSLEKLN